MGYQQIMKSLSQCGLGAVLLSEESIVLEVNETGRRLLHQESDILGRDLMEIAPVLCEESEEPLYENVAFGEYLIRCPSPEIDLPDRTRLIVFRNATNDACHDMLIGVLNQLSEAIALFDEKGRLYMLNDAVVKMESVVTRDVMGENVSEVYHTRDGESLIIPQALETHRPISNVRQHYFTPYGREIDVVCSAYPLVQNGQLLGAVTVMEDWKQISDLRHQILDMQIQLEQKERRNGAPSTLRARYHFEDICYTSKAMGQLIERCRQVAKGDSTVMIYGETGTGKELLAQSIHNASSRADGPFLAINCAAIPENLLEGLLFGTEKGAYTGAERREGLFELANGGTLLLDELNSMQIGLQAKLLRVLQEGTIRRVGGSTEIPVNIRILSNLNIPPKEAIAQGRLRQDLFYRLGVVTLDIPPLRDRKEDIPLLAKTYIIELNKRLDKIVNNIDQDTLRLFQHYDWPGNVRELQHAIEYAMNILPDDYSMITPEYLPESIHANLTSALTHEEISHETLNNAIHDVEYYTVCKALRGSKGNITEAARGLGLSRQSLQYRIRRYQINIPELLRSENLT